MQLRINGDKRIVARAQTVKELLLELGLDSRAVVVELNRAIIRQPALATTTIAEGDAVEIVHFVGGG